MSRLALRHGSMNSLFQVALYSQTPTLKPQPQLLTQGGDDDDVTIPALHISKKDGEALQVLKHSKHTYTRLKLVVKA